MKINDILRAKSMPLYFHALVIESTDYCNAKCDICYQDARSNSKRSDCNFLDIQEIKSTLTQATQIENLNKRFHLAGGEAFLERDKVVEAYMFAKKCGFVYLTGTTNGFWAKNYPEGLKYAKDLKKSGVTSLELSADYWHQKHVSAETISNCIDVCKDVGIAITLRMLATNSHRHKEALGSLRLSSLEKVDRITCSKVFFVGRARKTIVADDFYKKGAAGKCSNMLNLSINCQGNVYPCCAGLEQTNILKFGNIRNNPLIQIVDNISKSDIFRMIAFLGINNVLKIFEDSEIHLPTTENYGNMCELCWLVFSNKQYVHALQEHFESLKTKSLNLALQYLETEISAQQQ